MILIYVIVLVGVFFIGMGIGVDKASKAGRNTLDLANLEEKLHDITSKAFEEWISDIRDRENKERKQQ